MLGLADRSVALLLVLVHAGLLVWALAGLAEMVWTSPPWPRLGNPLFSDALLLLQWGVVTGAATTFLVGYARRWPRLPRAMVAWYLVMGGVCAWQTFFILENRSRYALMALEYVEYLVISIYLHRSAYMRSRHHRRRRAPASSFG